MSEYITSWLDDIDMAHVNEEIVRCRDCKHFASDELGDCCTLLDFEDVKPMDRCFCSWGERRDS